MNRDGPRGLRISGRGVVAGMSRMEDLHETNDRNDTRLCRFSRVRCPIRCVFRTGRCDFTGSVPRTASGHGPRGGVYCRKQNRPLAPIPPIRQPSLRQRNQEARPLLALSMGLEIPGHGRRIRAAGLHGRNDPARAIGAIAEEQR